MRQSRAVLAVMVAMSLAGVLAVPGVALSDEDAVRPPAEFHGRLGCPTLLYWQDTIVSNVVLGPVGDGDLVRRESRGEVFRPVVEEMSDSRFEGTWTAYMNFDEYVYPGVDMQDHPVVWSITQRIENDEGAWQGTAPDAYMPGLPVTSWGLVVLDGERAYDGLSAVLWTNVVEDTCACWEPDNQCQWEVRGFVFEGEMPPVPEVPAE